MISSFLKTKQTSPLLVAATLTVAAIAISAIVTDRRRRRSIDGGNDKKEKNVEIGFKDGSQEALVNERFQACAKAMGPQLSRLPQINQLDYYGLFKQGTLGDCSVHQSSPPPAADLVATTKYRAWLKFQGMDRMTAMQTYIDKAVHYQFIHNISDGEDDENYELEGDAVIDSMCLDIKPSTLTNEYDDKAALELEDSHYPLHAVAREGQLDALITLLLRDETHSAKESSHNANAPDDSGQTPLHLAADRGHIQCMKALVLAGADINSVDNDGISVLQAGVISGDSDCCRLLLLLGANPDQPDHDGDTPREAAQDDQEIQELFEQYDNETLSSEGLLDSEFVQELNTRCIPTTIKS